jgi:NitT/TauT family transport system permease protein
MVRNANIRQWIKVSTTLFALVLLWELACRFLHIAPFLLPSPTSIMARMAEKPMLFWVHGWYTLYETVAGFLVAVVVGLVAAAIIVVVPSIRDVLMPILLIAQLVPKVAIAPILLVWFGYGVAPKIVIAFLVAFFPIVVNTANGLMAVERELLDLGRSLEASRWQIFWKFRMPAALPELFSGMKIAITLAVIGAIIGEFVGGDKGLGYLIIIANQELDTPLAFAALVIISVAGIALYAAVEVSERFFVPWRQPVQPTQAAG